MIELVDMVFASIIPQPDRSVALVIASAINEARPHLGCWLGLGTMADRSGYSRRTVIRCLKNLEVGGVITIEKRSGSSSIYRMDKAIVAACARQETVTHARYVHSLAPTDRPVTPGHPCHTDTGTDAIAQQQPVPHSHPPVPPGHLPVPHRHPGDVRQSPPPVPHSHPESELESEVESEINEIESKVCFPLLKKGETPQKAKAKTQNDQVQKQLAELTARQPEETDTERIARIEANRQRQLEAVRAAKG